MRSVAHEKDEKKGSNEEANGKKRMNVQRTFFSMETPQEKKTHETSDQERKTPLVFEKLEEEAFPSAQWQGFGGLIYRFVSPGRLANSRKKRSGESKRSGERERKERHQKKEQKDATRWSRVARTHYREVY